MKRLYYGGTIVTMENERYAEALLCENGRIAAVGFMNVLSGMADEKINLNGTTLLPGFIDSHSHFTQVASSMTQASLTGATHIDQFRERIQAFIQERGLKPGEWVVARDYDHNLLPGFQHPGIAEIDSLAPGYPLMIQHQSGHMGLFNSEALRFLGVTEATASPEGGRIGQTDGRLNGYMEENAFYLYSRKAPMINPEQFLDCYLKAQQLYASYGITTMQDGYFVKEMLPLYQLLLGSDTLKLDLAAYPDAKVYDEICSEYPNHVGRYERHFKLGGMKIFLDGSPQGRTAWMRTPYLGDEPDYCGYGVMEDNAVLEAIALAAERRTQLLAHCNGDAAAAQFIRCLAQQEKRFPILHELRPVIIHAQFLGLDQLPEAAQLGMIASFFAAHVYHWGDTHIRSFGMARAERLSPAASALKVGLPFTFHQDAPVIPPDMIETLWCAANRLTKANVLLGGEERLPVWEALKAVTINGAYQYFEENDKGSLVAGKREDLVILSQNPLDLPVERLREIKILQTIKDGETVYKK